VLFRQYYRSVCRRLKKMGYGAMCLASQLVTEVELIAPEVDSTVDWNCLGGQGALLSLLGSKVNVKGLGGFRWALSLSMSGWVLWKAPLMICDVTTHRESECRC
jgi:hypothetical protein